MNYKKKIKLILEIWKWRIRKNYYQIFKKNYIRKKIANRKGTCGRHGCCDFSFFDRLLNIHLRKCLDKNDRTKSLRWNNLPFSCYAYPFDEKSKHPLTRSYCSFYW